MTVEELHAKASEAVADGLDYVLLTVRRTSQPKGQRVRLWPGMTGRYVGWVRDDEHLVEVDARKLEVATRPPNAPETPEPPPCKVEAPSTSARAREPARSRPASPGRRAPPGG